MAATLAGATATSQNICADRLPRKRCHSAKQQCQPAGQSVPFRKRYSASHFWHYSVAGGGNKPPPEPAGFVAIGFDGDAGNLSLANKALHLGAGRSAYRAARPRSRRLPTGRFSQPEPLPFSSSRCGSGSSFASCGGKTPKRIISDKISARSSSAVISPGICCAFGFPESFIVASLGCR
jgi:hypothetical protein